MHYIYYTLYIFVYAAAVAVLICLSVFVCLLVLLCFHFVCSSFLYFACSNCIEDKHTCFFVCCCVLLLFLLLLLLRLLLLLLQVVSEFDFNFVNVEQTVLFDLLLAADYLNIPSLLLLTSAKVASMIKGLLLLLLWLRLLPVLLLLLL